MRTSLALIVAVVSLLAVAAFAGGTRFTETAGGLPTAATDGVDLAGAGSYFSTAPVTSCRGSVRFSDGGTIMGGSLVPHYYDSVLGWVEGKDADQCAFATSKLLDGGSRHMQLCEFQVLADYGRVALAGKSLVGEDAGAVTPIMRLECWGPNLPTTAGSAQ